MHLTRNAKLAALALLAATLSGRAHAQDSRTVVEPTFPATCTTLPAQLSIAAGEPSSETSFDTGRIQNALNACAAGQAVELVASGTNVAFLIQPLTIPTGVTLLVDGGITVFASRNPADYQIAGKETCGTVGTAGNGCNPILNVNGNATSSGSGIMGYGVIDGRGEDKLLVNGAASTSSWWDVANAAQTAGGAQNNPILLAVSHANNFTLYKITFRNSPMFHVKWQSADGFTAWGVKVATPYTARNSDGIDPSGSDITVTHSSISDGDDNVALSASSATANITISNNNTYSGHGISVGSYTQGGLTNMLVQNINQAGTAADSNGIALRIKSAADRGGLVQNVTYQNICMQNHKTLIDIDPFYNSNAGTLIPQFSNITFQNVHGLTAGTITLEGHDANHITGIALNNFVFDTLAQTNISPAFSFDNITLGPGPVSPSFLQTQTGTGVGYTGNVSSPATAPYACSAANFTFLVGELYLSTATVINAGTLSNVPGPGNITLNAVLAPTMSQVTYGAYTGTPAPTAAVQFLEGAKVIGTAALAGNGMLASANLTGVTTGTHTYTAFYPGDSTYAAYTFGSVTVTVIPTAAPSTTTLTAAPSTVQATGTTVLTAVVNGTSLAAGPTGMVNFFDGTTQIGSAALTANAAGTAYTASYTATLGGPGTHNLKATYVGDPNNAASTSPVAAVAVMAIPTNTAVSLSSASVSAGSTATVTATVTASVGVPTGSVTFSYGGTVLGSAALNNGVATITTTSAAAGTQSLTASFAASGNYAASGSPAVTLTFGAPFSLTASLYAVSLSSGKSASVTLTATPAPGFSGTVTFACSSPVASVTCAVTPAMQAISGGAAVQSTIALTAAASASALVPGTMPGAPQRTPVYAFLLPLGSLALLGLTRGRRSRSLRSLAALVMLAGALGALAGLAGCSSSTPSQPPAPTTQVVTVTATSGAITQSIQVTVNVN